MKLILLICWILVPILWAHILYFIYAFIKNRKDN